jgi:hypothetical protein
MGGLNGRPQDKDVAILASWVWKRSLLQNAKRISSMLMHTCNNHCLTTALTMIVLKMVGDIGPP